MIMKNSKLLIIAILFACSFLAASPAKANATTPQAPSSSFWTDLFNALFGGGSNSGSSRTTGSTGSTGTAGGTSLPINNGVWFLIIAGGALGCKVIMNNNKETAPQNI